MALDLTNAVSLSRMVNKNLPTHTWLWNKFFKSEEHDTATIAVDIVSGSNRLASFKRVGAESDAVNSDNFTTKQFGPNQIGEKILTKAFDFAKRAPGMQLSYASGEKTIEERVAEKLGRDQRKLINRVWRAIEKMCADALFTDTVNNYDAKGNLIESFTMGVPSSHKIVKTGNDLWTAATADPFEQLAEFEVLVSQDSALDVTDYVLGKNAAKALLKNANAIEKFKINRGMFGVIDPKKPEAGAKFLGYTAEGANIWWCTETYENSAVPRPPMCRTTTALRFPRTSKRPSTSASSTTRRHARAASSARSSPRPGKMKMSATGSRSLPLRLQSSRSRKLSCTPRSCNCHELA